MMSSGKVCLRKPNKTLGLINFSGAQNALNSKRNRCAVYRHLRENGADCTIYMHEEGERGEKKVFVSQTSTNDPCNLCTY